MVARTPEVVGPTSAATVGPAGADRPAAEAWPAFDPGDLRRAQSGDPQALGRFFDHYFDRIFSVAYRFTGSVEVARDLTQDVFLKVRAHIGRLDLERDPAPWLYTVTVNACHDHRRSSWWRMSRHSVAIDHPGIGSALASQDSNPEHRMLAAEDADRIHAGIQRLRPDLRMSVILHDFEGLAHEAIAEILNIRHAAARKRHSRALLALAELLREDAGS